MVKLRQSSGKTDAKRKFKKSAMKHGRSQITKSIPAVTSDAEDENSSSASKFEKHDYNYQKKFVEKEVSESLEEDSENADSEDDVDTLTAAEGHKKSLQKLKNTDPDFYDFLAQNDKNLLDFDVDSSDDEGASKGDHGEDEEDLHKPDEMQVNSDESDFEPEDGHQDHSDKRITLNMLKQWEAVLRGEGKIKVSDLSIVIKAFNAAMLRVATDHEEKAVGVFKVEGSSVFNGVVQLCVLYLQPALKKYLGIEQSGKDPRKCKHFVKVKSLLIGYLTDINKLLSGVTSNNILTVLLKHLHQMSTYVACFSRISKLILKKLIILWSTGEETVRVLAFLCILRITRNQQNTLLDIVLKTMYMTYVKNSKFVSPTTWPGIHFMRRSLTEMFSLDLNVSYHHVFLYIRQLAIHLRNAIVVPKVENRQSVYNWQFVNATHLWANLLGATCNKTQLQPLLYPLVMILCNTVKLAPTSQYYPLRFHCIHILIKLSKDTGTFIPVLPFILEVLTSNDINKKNSKVSMKPLDFSCILRLSKSQLSENGFTDSVIDKIYALTLEYMSNESSSIAFPDLSILCIIQLKQFLKSCKAPNYTKKIKQLLEKIEENSKYIEKERGKVSFMLTDSKLIAAWETTISNRGTPLSKFFDSWYKIDSLKRKKKETKNHELAQNLPMITKVRTLEKVAEPSGPVELFPSDSEDENEMKFGKEVESEIVIEKKQNKKKVKKLKNIKEIKSNEEIDLDTEEKEDVVQDLNLKDW